MQSQTTKKYLGNTQLIRDLIRIAFASYCLFIGYKFYLFCLWASGKSTVMVSRPASVEAFLPISALASLRMFLYSGEYARIHPAGLTILLTAILISLLFRKGFCGWICPVGFISNLLERLGRRIKLAICLPKWLDIPLRLIKYIGLAFFVYMIFWKMDIESVKSFITSPYNIAVDAKMLSFFLHPSTLTLTVFITIGILSIVVRNFWCKYLCPYGALLGIVACISPVTIKRDESKCIKCKKCKVACPACIDVFNKSTIRSPECYGCLKCISVCPVKDCLHLGLPAQKKLPVWALPVMILCVFFGAWIIAELTGHWQTTMPIDMLKHIYSTIPL